MRSTASRRVTFSASIEGRKKSLMCSGSWLPYSGKFSEGSTLGLAFKGLLLLLFAKPLLVLSEWKLFSDLVELVLWACELASELEFLLTSRRSITAKVMTAAAR